MECLEIFTILESVEVRLEMVYTRFADVFAGDGEARDLFKELAVQEENHAQMVRLAARTAQKNLALGTAPDFDFVAAEKVLQCAAHLQQNPPPTLEQAVREALEIENSAFESHSQNVFSGKTTPLQSLLITLRQSDRRHVKIIQSFAHRRGFDPPEGNSLSPTP